VGARPVPDGLIRITTALVVVGVPVVTAIVSYEPAYAVVSTRTAKTDGRPARPTHGRRAYLLQLHGHAPIGPTQSCWHADLCDSNPFWYYSDQFLPFGLTLFGSMGLLGNMTRLMTTLPYVATSTAAAIR
jgi:hypothetical protein